MRDASGSARAAPRDLLDRLAIGLSGLCLVHCVATAALVALVASAGGALLDPAIHRVGLALAMVLAMAGLGRGYLVHRRTVPAVIGAAGLALMAAGLVVPHGPAETAVTVAGVALVAFAHLRNRRCARAPAA